MGDLFSDEKEQEMGVPKELQTTSIYSAEIIIIKSHS